MKADHKPTSIPVKLIGNPDENGVVRLDDLGDVCQSLSNCLREVERCVTGHAAKIEYAVGVRGGSVIMDAAPLVSRGAKRTATTIVAVFSEAIHSLEHGQGIDKRLDHKAIESFRKLFSPIGRSGCTLFIANVELSHRFVKNIDASVSETGNDLPSHGSVSGKLDSIHLHGQLKFVLYPTIGGGQITCEFPEELYSRVYHALRKHVTVYGKLIDSKKLHPSRIIAADIEEHPDDSRLPRLGDLRGIARATKGDSVKLIRQIRDDF